MIVNRLYVHPGDLARIEAAISDAKRGAFSTRPSCQLHTVGHMLHLYLYPSGFALD